MALCCDSVLAVSVGFNQPLVAIQQDKVSQAVPFLSYAPPVPALIESASCAPTTDNGTHITECPRLGAFLVTILGTNFGEDNAGRLEALHHFVFGLNESDVLFGGSRCVEVTHDGHTKLTCVAPSGNLLARTVILVQNQGETSQGSDPLLVSYTQCPPGTREAGLDCVNCTTGFFSPAESQPSCRVCQAGRRSAVNGRCGHCHCCLKLIS